MKFTIALFLIWAALMGSFYVGRYDRQQELIKDAEQTDNMIASFVDSSVIIRSGMAETVIWQMQDGSVWQIDRDGNRLKDAEIILK